MVSLMCDGKRWENLFECWKILFWPANGVQSTQLLVKIHNSDPFTNFMYFFIDNVNDNLDDLELFQLIYEKDTSQNNDLWFQINIFTYQPSKPIHKNNDKYGWNAKSLTWAWWLWHFCKTIGIPLLYPSKCFCRQKLLFHCGLICQDTLL